MALLSLGLAFAIPFAAVPVAIATLTMGIIYMRRASPSVAAGGVIVVLSVISLLIVAFIALFLLQATTQNGDPMQRPTVIEPG
ncbi:MAG: hypothetical protein HGA44_02735 [Cellulomonadaceae bacterium]|nr:hypothetical protein [Cellulomonadaceae bacterium]